MALRALIAVALAACSPFGNRAFPCTTNDQCGAGGSCAGAGFCAFPDTSCGSGLKYGDLSGDLSNTCVGGQVDAGIDAKVFLDAPIPGVTCYGTGLAVACFTNFTPSGSVNLAAGPLDTSASGMCANNVKDNPPYCVIAAADITVATGTLAVHGTKPLVLIATNTITIDGTLDVASHRTPAETFGPAYDFAGCAAGTAPTAAKGGGGAGGSFGGNGGNGGDGPMAGTHGVAGAGQTAGALRGGCPGQDGDGNGGPPGHGGGVVYLIAEMSIAVSAAGSINASGEAGGGGTAPSPGGGGGGGAGGLIGLDSPMVTVTGAVFANGGGGAEGAGATTNIGFNGNDPTVAGAPAANGGSSGGAGGAGGVLNTADGSNGANANSEVNGMSGGGGGGSVGVIKLHRAAAIGGGGVVSPPHS